MKLLVSAAVMALVFAATAAAQDSMKVFTSHDGRFAITMPGTPQTESAAVNQMNGEMAIAYRFWVDVEGSIYMLMYNDDAKPLGPPQARLEAARNGVLNEAKGDLIYNRVISWNGVPGLAYKFRMDMRGALLDVESYYTGRRLYQIVVGSPPGKTAAFRDAYMSSFRILP